MSCENSLAEKFSNLEEEVFSIKMENRGLRTELFEVVKKNKILEKKVQVLEERMAGGPAQDPQALRKNFCDLEKRIGALENGVSTLTSADNRFATEKESMKTELSALSTKTDNIKYLKGRMDKLENDAMPEIKSKVANVDRRLKNIENLKGRVDKLENDDMPEIKNKIASVDRRLKKIKALKGRVNKLENDDMPEVKDVITNVDRRLNRVVTTVGQFSGLRRVLSRTLAASQSGGSVDAKVESLSDRTNEIEKWHGDVKHSVTRVRVNTKDKTLITGRWVHLDTRYRRVFGNIDGLWDSRRRGVVARRGGRYGVGAIWIQEGKGVINVGVEWDGSGEYVSSLGRTSGNEDGASGMTVIDLKEGEAVWVVAWRGKGEAVLVGCEMFCWLMG